MRLLEPAGIIDIQSGATSRLIWNSYALLRLIGAA
jgi:hypothetical protein